LTFIVFINKGNKGEIGCIVSAAKLLKGLLEDKVFILNLYKINNTNDFNS